MKDERPSLLAQNPATIAAWVAERGWPRFRAAQIAGWVFERRTADPNAMGNLPRPIREALISAFQTELPRIASRLDAEDGASKLLLDGPDGRRYEAVILRYAERTSLCVSSQVGCKLACGFCQTGKLGFFRHLTEHEILGQFWLADSLLAPEGRRLTHGVFMGMGEPLANTSALFPALRQLTSPEGFGISPRRITVSTSGLVPQIHELAGTVPVNLAISLHAGEDELRSQLMPINRRYNLATLKEALIAYQQQLGRPITVEYLLIKGVNDSRSAVRSLVRYLHGIKAKVNLIPFNPHPGLPYEKPDEETCRAFQRHLAERGYPAPIRYSKGAEVSAACGQLAAKEAGDTHEVPRRSAVIPSRRVAHS